MQCSMCLHMKHSFLLHIFHRLPGLISEQLAILTLSWYFCHSDLQNFINITICRAEAFFLSIRLYCISQEHTVNYNKYTFKYQMSIMDVEMAGMCFKENLFVSDLHRFSIKS